jgi:hypothetical protein
MNCKHGTKQCLRCVATRSGLVAVIEADLAGDGVSVLTDDGSHRILVGGPGGWSTTAEVVAVPNDTAPVLDYPEFLADVPEMTDLRCLGTALVARAIEWGER